MVRKFVKEARGATAIEYALVAALISVALISGATAVGNSSTVQLKDIANQL